MGAFNDGRDVGPVGAYRDRRGIVWPPFSPPATWPWLTRSKTIEMKPDVRLTIYGEFLESHPPTHEAEIHQPSAWSCPHGVDRWRRDCGCNSGGHGGWNQAWREPLRNALDWLRDQLASLTKTRARRITQRPLGGARRLYQCHPGSISRRTSATVLRAATPRAPLSQEEQVAAMRNAGAAAARACSCTPVAAGSLTKSPGWNPSRSPICGPGRAIGAGNVEGRSGKRLSRDAGQGQKQYSRKR